MRRLAKILLAIFTVLLVIAGGFYLYLVHLGGAESIVNRRLQSLLQGKYQLNITVGEIKGDILNDLIVEDVTVYYGDSITGYRMLQLPRLSTAYSFSNIWNRRYLFDYIHIDSALFTLQSDSAGRWQLPNFTGEKKDQPTQAASFPGFAVDELVINNLDITIIRPEDTVSVDDLVLTLAVQSEDKTYSAHIKRFEFSSNQQRLVLGSAGGKLTYSEGSLVMKDIALVSEDTRIKLDGMARVLQPVEGYVDFAVDQLDLADVAAWIGPKLKGVVDLNGRVQLANDVLDGSVDIGGDFMIAGFENLFVDFRFADKTLYLDTLIGTILDNCAVDGYGLVDFSRPKQTYELTAEIRQFNLKSLIRNSFYSNLNGHLVLQGESFRQKDMLLNFYVDLFESVFDEYPLQKANGRMAITTKSIEFMDGFNVSYFENVFNAHGLVEYSGDMNIEVTADLKNLDRYQYSDKLFLEQPGGRGHVEAVVSGKTLDPDLAGIFVSDSVWLYGLYCDSMYSTVDIKRFLTGKQGTVEVDFYRGAAWDLPYDTGYAFVRVDSNLVHIDTAVMWSEYTLEGGRGTFDYGVEPSMLTVDTIWLNLFDQPFHNKGSIDIAIDSLGFDFQRAAIGNNGAMLSLLGRVNYDETMDLLLAVQKIPIEPWKNLFVDTLDVAGCLSCEARVQGSFQEPKFTLMAEVDSLVYRDLVLGDLATRMSFENQLLTIDSFQVLSHPGYYRADGSFYIDLAFTTDSLDRFPEEPMNINVTAFDNRFDLVSLMLPSVEQLDGDLVADFVISGTPHEPHLEGEAYIKGARLKYFDLAENIYSDSVGVTMTDNRVVIDSVATYIIDNRGSRNERPRWTYIQGEIIVKTLENFYYNLDVNIHEETPFTYELDDIKGRVSGRLHIEGDTPPLVTGDLEIIEMKYLVNFAEENEGSPVMAALTGENTWDLGIDISIVSNYWIKNDDIDAEFAGEMSLLREAGTYRFVGEMEILRGRGFLLDKTFRLESGGLVTFEGNEIINPRLDIIGSTNIATQPDEEGATEQLLVEIHIGGTLEEPEITPTESSDIASQEDLLPILFANYYSSGSAEAESGFGQRVTSIMASQVAQIGARQLGKLGVETFEIEAGSGGALDPANTRVTLGFYTSQNLYIYGRSAISGQARQEVGFEYRLNKSFLIQGVRDEEELYHLNLNLHWEF